MVGSIGFTMSLFIDNLAFTDPEMVAVGKAAVLVTSAVAVVLGFIAVKITGRKKEA
jgi:NhaA family Na+:H+ antiporter